MKQHKIPHFVSALTHSWSSPAKILTKTAPSYTKYSSKVRMRMFKPHPLIYIYVAKYWVAILNIKLEWPYEESIVTKNFRLDCS